MKSSRFAITSVFLGLLALSYTQVAVAAPSSIFSPILRSIQRQLPKEMVMRLPASIKLVGQGKKIPIYADLEPYENGEFRISIASQPNCQARYCQLGYIATFKPNYNSKNNYHLSKRSEGTSVNLGSRVRGVFVDIDTEGASSGRYGIVVWEQNNQTFLVSLPFFSSLSASQNKKTIVSVAQSMATQPPIRSSK